MHGQILIVIMYEIFIFYILLECFSSAQQMSLQKMACLLSWTLPGASSLIQTYHHESSSSMLSCLLYWAMKLLSITCMCCVIQEEVGNNYFAMMWEISKNVIIGITQDCSRNLNTWDQENPCVNHHGIC